MLNKHRFAAALAFGGISLICSSAAAETIEQVEKKLTDAFAKVTTMQSKLKSTIDSGAEGLKIKTITDGTYEYAKNGRKAMFRVDTKTTMTTEMGAQTNSRVVISTTINDGDNIYTLTDESGKKQAVRTRADSAADQPVFESMRKSYNIKLMPDETINGVAVYVVEGRPKMTQSTMPDAGRTLNYFQKETGVAIKMVTFDPGGRPMMTTEYSDIKINPTIAPDRFTYKPIPGVELQDMTAGAPPKPMGGK